MADEQKKTGAQKKQVKFSGLINSGVLSPLNKEEDDQKFVSVISSNVSNTIPEPIPTVVTIPSLQLVPNESAITPISIRRAIRIDSIDDSPYQPRELYDPAEIDNLAHSLAAGGLDEPITVRLKANGRHELIKGHRRTRAGRSLGWIEIDADVVDKTDREAKLSAMISNEGRVDLTDYERSKLYQEAKESNFAKTQEEIAHLFGTTQERVSARMAMLKLPKRIIELLEHNPKMFGATTAKEIRQLLSEYPNEEALIEKAVLRINDGANENSVNAWVKQMLKPTASIIPQYITDKAGRTVFKAKFTGREFTIQIKDDLVDAKEIEEIVLATLRARAEIGKL
jgi:ParB/RepB/Spo0J family partition protein